MHKTSTHLPRPHDDSLTEQTNKEKMPFVEPKLTFIVPKLVKQGSVTDITRQGGGGFFGTFSP